MRWRRRIETAAIWFALAVLLSGCGGEIPSPERVDLEFGNDHTALVTWDTVDGASGYRVFKKTGLSTNYQYVCDVEENSYLDSGLDHGETYSYKVKTHMDGQLSGGTESEAAAYMEIPAISGLRVLDETRLEVSWEETGAARYRLYGAASAGGWLLAGETGGTSYVLDGFSSYERLALSAVYPITAGDYETPLSGEEPLLTTGHITAVTQLDRYTAVVQYDAVRGARGYQVYRSETENGAYILAGTSYDPVYYDEIGDGTAYYYKVRAVTDKMEGQLSHGIRLGTNAKEVSGVAVFMYHEFVTQEDLDAGVAFDEYAVWAEEFEEDLRYLKENGYTTITASQLADFLNGRGTLPEKAVMLTIDDGKLGVYKNAYPLLQKYGMKAVLAVIGERIDEVGADPQARASEAAPYCTWSELGEMAASGTIELVSHSYTRHRYRNGGHTGANIADGESEDAFYQTAVKDFERMDQKLREVTGKGAVALSYPYSVRSTASDRVWLRCGYEVLLCGDSDNVRHSRLNYYVQDAGVNYYSARTRRLVRLTGTPLQTYLETAVSGDDWPLT